MSTCGIVRVYNKSGYILEECFINDGKIEGSKYVYSWLAFNFDKYYYT